jgi:hypothetical protein
MHHSGRLLVPALLLTAALVALAPATALGYSRTTMFGTWEVPVTDIASLGGPRSQVLVKAFSPGMNIVAYLDKAKAYGQQVAVYFTDTVDYATGKIYTSRIKPWVDKVKGHTALYGYVSVKEPSWSGISLAEMRSLYAAYKAADPAHRVIALLGDVPHFGSSANPWGTGVANMLWIDWYPVTYSRGYIATASKWFPKIRAYVNKVTPGVPIWLMVQAHGYKPGDRKTPTAAQLAREVRDGFKYLKANGILFHTWNNPRYGSDLKRNHALWSKVRSIMSKVRAGTF